MNNIEQDNINTELDVGAKKWSSGHIAQLMVLLNGLVLTFIAYFAINIFVHDMMEQERKQLHEDSYKVVSENIGNLESTIKAAATITALSRDENITKIKEKIGYAVQGLEYFDRLMWVQDTDGNGYEIHDIKKPSNYSRLIISKGSEPGFIKTVSEQKNTYIASDVFVTTTIAGSDFIQENADPVIKGRPFALVANVTGNDERQSGIIIGISRISNILDKSWIDKKAGITKISIRDERSGDSVFFLNRNGEDTSEFLNDMMTSAALTRNLQLGTAKWEVSIVTGENAGTFLLAKTPWLILFFGLSLTLVGTLYIRNNQRQSSQLKLMNRALAQKNYELNSEISERERLLQAMRKAERENRAIINSVNDIIFETDMDGQILFVNDTWRVVTGMETDEASGKNLFDLLHPQDQIEQQENFTQLIKGQKQAYRSFTRIRTDEGRYRSIELAMSMLRQDENKNLRVVGTITDVEERRRAESALGEAEKKYRTIVENAAGGIYQVTPEGHVLSANPAMARILGFDNAEQMIREITNIHEDIYVRRKDRARFIRELETTGAVKNFEIEAMRKDGKTIWLNENARAVKDEEGTLLYFEGSIEDITGRKETEIKLKDAKISSDLANRAKSEFLANMSHELRTPLNAIIGFSEIIKNEMLGPLDQRQYWEYAKDIHDSGNNLLKIINDILEVSKIEASDRQLNEGLLHIDKVMESALDLVMPKIEANGLSVSNLIDGNVPHIIGEDVAIKQIFVNLLSNAAKFTPKGGRITLSYEYEDGGPLRLSITDTGVGLNEKEIEKALSPFGQVETALNRSSSGAGLGLTLVNSLIRLHGGSLELFSQKGIGTTATIVLPKKRVTDASGKPLSDQDDAGGHENKSTQRKSRNPGNFHEGSSKIQ